MVFKMVKYKFTVYTRCRNSKVFFTVIIPLQYDKSKDFTQNTTLKISYVDENVKIIKDTFHGLLTFIKTADLILSLTGLCRHIVIICPFKFTPHTAHK